MRSEVGTLTSTEMEPTASPGAPLRFIDSHHHLWDLSAHTYDWLSGEGSPETTAWIGDYSAIRTTYRVGNLLTDTAGLGLARSVHVEATWSGDPVEETRWLQSVSIQWGFPSAAVVAVDLCAPDAASQLDRHLAYPVTRGVRMSRMGDLVSQANFRRGFAALAKRGLSYDVNIHYEDAEHVLRLAADFPDTHLVIDNMANPPSLEAGVLWEWRRSMALLARAPNAYLKVSGLGMADHHWTQARIRPWVESAFDLFTPRRCMFGSNWPVDRLYGSYRRLFFALCELLAGFSESERNAFFWSTAQEFYRL